MASTDFNDIIIATVDWLDEAALDIGGFGGTGVDFATADAERKRWVNRGYKDILREVWRTAGHMQGVSKELFTWVDGTELYTFSNSNVHIIKWVEGGWDESDERLRAPILPVDYEERRGYYGESWATGGNSEYYGRWYFLNEGNVQSIGFVPVPSATKSTTNIKVWYFANPADMAVTDAKILKELEPYTGLIGLRTALMIYNSKGIEKPMLIGEFARQLEDFKDAISRPQVQRPDVARYHPNDIWD